MMRLMSSVRLLLLLGLMGACVGPLPIPDPGRIWVVPILAVLAGAGLLVDRRLPARIWAAAAAVLGLLALYAANPSHRWADGIGLLPIDHWTVLPAAAFRAGAWQVMTLATGLLAAYALAFRLSARQRQALLVIATAGAVAMAIGVWIQRLEPRRHPIYELTGVFVNENHFAVFANLLLPGVLALASRARFRAVQSGSLSSPAGLFWLSGVLLAGAVVLSRSRAGVAVMALLVLLHVWRCRRLVRQFPFMDTPAAARWRGLGWLAVAGAAALALATLTREWRSTGDLVREGHFRLGMARDTLHMWRDQPTWGIGPGSFTTVFPYYQSDLFRGRTILHAHSEPVQTLSEYGWAGVLWLAGFVGLALSARPRGNPPSANGAAEIPAFADLERSALAAGLLALVLHSLIDFPLRIPLITMIAATWAGLWAASRPREGAGIPGDAEPSTGGPST